MTRPYLAPLAAAVALLAGGCASSPLQAAADFKASPASGSGDDRFVMLLVPPASGTQPALPPSLAQIFRHDDALKTQLLRSGCGTEASLSPQSGGSGPGPMALPALLLPLLTEGARFFFERWVERGKEKLADLEEASQATYQATVNVEEPSSLAGGPCLVLFRYGIRAAEQGGEATVQPGMSAVLKLRPARAMSGAGAFLLAPVYLRMFNAVAVTRDSGTPVVSASVAVSLKAQGREGSTMPRLLPAGEGTLTLAKVPIGEQAAARDCSGEKGLQPTCGSTDMVVYPLDKGALSLTVAITERGAIGINFKRASAELDALKAALGPAIASGIKDQLGQ